MPKYADNAINSLSAPRRPNLYSTSLSCRNGRLDSDSAPAPATSPEPAALINTSERYCTCTSSEPESVGPQPKQDDGPTTGGDDYNAAVGDADDRRSLECRAVGVEWRPVHRHIAGSVCPGGVAAAVTEASLMPYEDLPGAELVAVGAAGRRVGDPLAGLV
jgi:hypothetical protein